MWRNIQDGKELAEFLANEGWTELQRKKAPQKRVFQKTGADGTIYQVTVPVDESLWDYSFALDAARREIAASEGWKRGFPRSPFPAEELNRRLSLCEECMSDLCIFAKNGHGYCTFPLVAGRSPRMSDEDGCEDSIFDE